MAGALGVCSWSLRPASAADLIDRVLSCGLRAVQLALDPVRREVSPGGGWDMRATWSALGRSGIEVLSGMMAMAGEDYSTLESIRRTGGLRPDSTWQANLDAAKANAEIAYQYGLTLVTFHAGFVPEQRGGERDTLIERLRRITDVFAQRGVSIGLETGQETAANLAELLDEVGNPMIGVNFDPANMLLYGMGDPVAGLRTLSDWVLQLHIKDATPSARPNEWGKEAAAGQGAVDWPGLFAAVRECELDIDCVIEREWGEGRERDVIAARDLVRGFLPDLAGEAK